MYRDNRTGAELATFSDIRRARPDISLPEDLTDDVIVEQDFSIIAPAPQPSFDPTTHEVQSAPAQLVNGTWTQTWVVVELSPEQRMANAKAARQLAVDNIKVTTQAGHTFDGDEVSQGRMSRAIIALDAAGQTSTTWVLSNNMPTNVTRADLVEALVLAGQEQTRLWMQPWA